MCGHSGAFGPTASTKEPSPSPNVWQITLPAWRDIASVRKVVGAAGVVSGSGWLISLVYLGAGGGVDVATFGWLTGGFVLGLVGLVAVFCTVLVALRVQVRHHFELDKNGATTYVSAEPVAAGQAGGLLLSLGRSFASLGARLGAKQEEEKRVLWTEVDSFWVNPRQPVIKLKRGGRTVLVIRASKENQDAVCRYVRSRVRPPGSGGPGTRHRKALWEWLERS